MKRVMSVRRERGRRPFFWPILLIGVLLAVLLAHGGWQMSLADQPVSPQAVWHARQLRDAAPLIPASSAGMPDDDQLPIVLQWGDMNESVLELQERLIELGYLSDTADGVYGGNTERAVSAFQENAALPATGVADADTLFLLMSEDAPPAFYAADEWMEDQQETTVYVAPHSGKRYHESSDCRGLSKAKSVESRTLSEAERQNYTPCKICY